MHAWEAIFDLAVFGAIFVLVVVAVPYGWSEWWTKGQRAREKPNRKIIITVGLVGITAQLLLFIALWTPLTRSITILWRCMIAEFLLISVVLPAVVIWKSHARWWILASSVALPILSFFVVLAQIAY